MANGQRNEFCIYIELKRANKDKILVVETNFWGIGMKSVSVRGRILCDFIQKGSTIKLLKTR